MKIGKNKMVSLVYELREGNIGGSVIETIEEDSPLNFIFGTSHLLPSFESQINSLGKGDTFDFILPSASAYGERREEMIIDVPATVFEKEGRVDENICRVGNQVPMVDSSGNPLTGIILEITDQSVRMDFNHPMAGVDLCFSGQILDVREPTQAELAGNYTCSGCDPDTQSGCSGSCDN
jgi:FKBP-type peptidyl-prolyl cis-trans isomerase SlyD